MLAGDPVGLAHRLIVDADLGRAGKGHTSTGVARERNHFQEVLRDRTQAARRNQIIRQRLPADRIHQARRNAREIAAALSRGRNERDQTSRRRVNPRPLKSPKVKQFSLDNRAARAAAELIPLQRILRRRKKLPRVERPVP